MREKVWQKYCLLMQTLVNNLAKNPSFRPTPQILKPLFFPCFFYFRKICSCHHCHYFHLHFCWVLTIGWGEMIFCQTVGKRGVKLETFLMWNGVKSFWGKPVLPCNFFGGQSSFHPCFWKNREAAYFFHPTRVVGEGGALLSRIFTDACRRKMALQNFIISWKKKD